MVCNFVNIPQKIDPIPSDFGEYGAFLDLRSSFLLLIWACDAPTFEWNQCGVAHWVSVWVRAAVCDFFVPINIQGRNFEVIHENKLLVNPFKALALV